MSPRAWITALPLSLALWALLFVGLSHAQFSSPLPAYTDAMASAAAPVQSVNTQKGAVTVPGSIRASCNATTFDASGNGTCTLGSFSGGSVFSQMPDCVGSWTAGNSNYVYAAPLITNSQTAPTAVTQAALKILTISLGLTTIWASPPTGSTLTVVCRGQ